MNSYSIETVDSQYMDAPKPLLEFPSTYNYTHLLASSLAPNSTTMAQNTAVYLYTAATSLQGPVTTGPQEAVVDRFTALCCSSDPRIPSTGGLPTVVQVYNHGPT